MILISLLFINVHTKNVPFIASPSMAALSHGKPPFAGTSRDIYGAQKQTKEPASRICIHSCTLSPNIHIRSQVGRPRNRGSVPDRPRDFLYSKVWRPAVGPHPPSHQMYIGVSCPREKQPGREADLSPRLVPIKRILGALNALLHMFSWNGSIINSVRNHLTLLHTHIYSIYSIYIRTFIHYQWY
jgi:hypothetical protein